MTTGAVARCINLDWLEVSVEEPLAQPRDAEYFRSCGWVVYERDYGTRVWGQMFTLLGDDHLPFIEVRRAPKSQIIASNVAHLRIVNRVCYFPNAADIVSQFIETYGYTFHHITRVDVCYDFEHFDYGDLPRDFVRRFMNGRYSKINQADISAHGSDRWDGRVWNSVSWGSPSSDIGTKLYNKTLELYDPVTKQYSKPYIRQAWQACGLVDNAVSCTKTLPDGSVYKPEIWRVEFSIRSSVRSWFVIRLNGKASARQSLRNTLDMYNSRDKLTVMFATLSQHYFHFKYLLKRYDFYKVGHSSGNPVRKDRCPDKLLFNWRSLQVSYKVERQSVATSEKPDKLLVRLLAMLRDFRDSTLDAKVRQNCTALIDYLTYRVGHDDQTNPINRQDAEALQLALARHIANPSLDPAQLIKIARDELRIRDAINPFF